ncbi:MAG: hypothetical protein ABIO05_08880 [Ferruginibacter sp.]
MSKKKDMRFPFVFCLIFFIACNQEPVLTKVMPLPDYPSGSAIAHFKKNIYLMGDDAPYLLVIDTGFRSIDTIQFFSSADKRIPKDVKKDPEAITNIEYENNPALLLLGSGSLPTRNICWIIIPTSKQKITISLDTFYRRLQQMGIKEINIEGAATTPSGIVLACRGNKAFAKNYLIFTSHNFWHNQQEANIQLATLGVQSDTSNFVGVSGLEYSKLHDQLLITLSTENTYDAYTDGVIGKSFLWQVNDISLKHTYSGINPNKTFDLEAIDGRFKKQKIESVCILAENASRQELLLVADDDKGGSVLFQLTLPRKP